MKYAFPQFFAGNARFLTFSVVADALRKAGHEVTADCENCDIIAVSLCSVRDMPTLRRIIRENKNRKVPVLVGGTHALCYWSVGLYADLVWLGDVYDMADCRDVQELAQSPYCYNRDPKKQLFVSFRIDWDKVPVCQIGKTQAYYWGGVGCKNKCRFCHTSWTHRHLVNSEDRIEKARLLAEKKKLYLMVCSNEYDKNNKLDTRDMLLRDYIRTPVHANHLRLGIEFASEAVRAYMGKPITKDDIFRALQKIHNERVNIVKLFHITGYEPLEDWDKYIAEIGDMAGVIGIRKMIMLMFNNLNYQNYTPLYRERKKINWEYYSDIKKAREWNDAIALRSHGLFVRPATRFAGVACDFGISEATTIEQLRFWEKMGSQTSLKKYTPAEYQRALFDSGVMENKERRIDFDSGEIKIIDEVNSVYAGRVKACR